MQVAICDRKDKNIKIMVTQKVKPGITSSYFKNTYILIFLNISNLCGSGSDFTVKQTHSLTECLILFYLSKWLIMPSWGFMISFSVIYFQKIMHICNNRVFYNFSNSADLKI